MLGLVGENGAGKSTLMKILFGMDSIRETGGYDGEILLNGQKADFQNPFEALSAGIGMVHQEFSLIPGFTAAENILLNREPQKKSVISEIFGERMNTLNRKEMDRATAVLGLCAGSIPVYMHIPEEKITLLCPKENWCSGDEACLRRLKDALGAENVVLKQKG